MCSSDLSTVNSSLASSVTNGTISQATSSTISNAVASATSSVAKSLIRNGELDASTVLNAFEAAGAGAAASALTAQVDGFSDLPKGVQAALNRGLADEFLGASSDKITQDMLLASLTGLRGKIDIFKSSGTVDGVQANQLDDNGVKIADTQVTSTPTDRKSTRLNSSH